MKWTQSNFTVNCPIYYVLQDSITLMRIEYDFDFEHWNLGVLNDTGLKTFKAGITEIDKAKTACIELYKETLEVLNNVKLN